MNSYQSFAFYYDKLTANIPYGQRGEYFHTILQQNGVPEGGVVLDLACGTGSLTEVLARLGYDMIGVDISPEMLMEAMDKKYDSGLDILYLQQEMQELDLYGRVDACVCALDSVNHVTDPVQAARIFERVGLFLEPGGIFVFDVNSLYKHQQVLSGQTFVYDLDEVFCVWQNSPCEDNQIEITLDLFEADEDGEHYRRETEEFAERAYTHEEILSFLKGGQMELVACYGDDTLEPPREKTERLIYVAKSVKRR